MDINQDNFAQVEHDYLSGMLERLNSFTDERNYRTVDIWLDKKNKKLAFQFRVRPLTEDEVITLRKRASPYNKKTREREYDSNAFRPLYIYAATIEEDRAKLWDNLSFQKSHNLFEGIDVIKALLKPGEIVRVANIISELSGFDDEEDDLEEEIAKN
jgi:hypothetical protein